ncbi:coiled-coil domain-containing protein 124-B-like [Polypterus senegalus]|uniref:coiled-coil domain-containing protein 124-B-like n=1 Tax=Polypterus senegalus TaxID=55291 RepID=UPI001964B010|nr:coiled-coil domain-containing protein 124-B-like [Polypterus senegalus]
MPKKFQGENTKAAAARARKAEAKAEAECRKKQEQEDAFWRDDDKHVMKKEQRKDQKEKKRLEVMERKKENQRLLEEEDSKIKGRQPTAAKAPSKVTRAQIEETLRKEQEKSNEETKGTEETLGWHLGVQRCHQSFIKEGLPGLAKFSCEIYVNSSMDLGSEAERILLPK